MVELPEAMVLARQVNQIVRGKRIQTVVAGAFPHKFAWYSGDPSLYPQHLNGKVLGEAQAWGGIVEIQVEDRMLSISAPLKYHTPGAARPKKHQLMIEFEDGSSLSSTIQMWGGLFCYPVGGQSGFIDETSAKQKPSPIGDAFDWDYFIRLNRPENAKLSAKAFLATEQRIPGLGNGVLQDILWTARIHPKQKMGDLSTEELEEMFKALKTILAKMAEQGGRDTENDLFDQPGGYRTILSKFTVGTPCPACATEILKEAYLGGSVYYCHTCQAIG